MSENKTFPEYFPSCCPDDKAVDANGNVFRILKENKITDGGFLSHYELKISTKADLCKCCSISLYDSLEGALHRQRLSPRLGNFIAEGTLNPSSGKTSLPNKISRHMEWWTYNDTERHSFFRTVKPCT